jgi:predicted transcriptional regulator
MMQIELTQEQEAHIATLAARTGRSVGEVVREALADWVADEAALAELKAGLDQAEAQAARSEGRVITRESMLQLADDVKQRGRARLAADKAAQR